MTVLKLPCQGQRWLHMKVNISAKISSGLFVCQLIWVQMCAVSNQVTMPWKWLCGIGNGVRVRHVLMPSLILGNRAYGQILRWHDRTNQPQAPAYHVCIMGMIVSAKVWNLSSGQYASQSIKHCSLPSFPGVMGFRLDKQPQMDHINSLWSQALTTLLFFNSRPILWESLCKIDRPQTFPSQINVWCILQICF